MQLKITERQLSILIRLVKQELGDPLDRSEKTPAQEKQWEEVSELQYKLEAYEQFNRLRIFLEED